MRLSRPLVASVQLSPCRACLPLSPLVRALTVAGRSVTCLVIRSPPLPLQCRLIEGRTFICSVHCCVPRHRPAINRCPVNKCPGQSTDGSHVLLGVLRARPRTHTVGPPSQPASHCAAYPASPRGSPSWEGHLLSVKPVPSELVSRRFCPRRSGHPHLADSTAEMAN